MTPRLVLVGGGHAHLEVLRRAARDRARGVPWPGELALVSPAPVQLYSGMMPAQLHGSCREPDLAIELGALCRAAGARFVEDTAVRVRADADGATVQLATGGALEASHCSLDVGSSPAGLDALPGARAHVFAVRPLARWRALVSRVDGELTDALHDTPFTACVVGGGAGGVELAFALAARVRRASRSGSVTLVDEGDRLLPAFGAAGTRVEQLLARAGVVVRTKAPVAEVLADAVHLVDGTRIPSVVTVWTTGAAPPPIVRDSAVPTDPHGFLHVDATLRAIDGRRVWGAGDCVALADAPWVPRSGVHAVREAPVLAANLRAALHGDTAPARRYRPQRHHLVALDTGDGRAFLHRGDIPFTVHARWALRLKRHIDERFVARYRVAAP
jgi:NADH dehydrogenase FAD-containing subunit